MRSDRSPVLLSVPGHPPLWQDVIIKWRQAFRGSLSSLPTCHYPPTIRSITYDHLLLWLRGCWLLTHSLNSPVIHLERQFCQQKTYFSINWCLTFFGHADIFEQGKKWQYIACSVLEIYITRTATCRKLLSTGFLNLGNKVLWRRLCDHNSS